MPRESLMFVLGNLTHTPVLINSGDLLFSHKFMEGATLYDWIPRNSPDRKNE